ncbi:DUF3560 domain-containing protein [Photobacterium leiognathi]|uniref:DUF3560 domain-containing protein n=1 Tax=Photobacterium leiognathi TaxID=553611 RepID=UPI002739A18D|nr:DUF3560 domain-containing protein [Photobacterium leiognathi]
MTYSADNHSTISNQIEATNVSPLEQSGSNKNEILNSLKAGKLRKNAKNKIAALLSAATYIEFRSQSMGMDDCWNSNEPRAISVTEFWTWYDKEYSELNIWVDCKEGKVSRVRFSDCMYHFSNDVVLTFDAVTTPDNNQSCEEAEQGEAVELASFEQYEALTQTATVKQVNIIWSESRQFTDNDVLTLDGYNEKSQIEALDIGRGQGYAKTKLEIIFADGTREIFRHDIDADYPTLCHYYAAVSQVKLLSQTKAVLTYQQVRQALLEGYLSPLNSTEKHPTPPESTEKSRKVLSLGDYKARIESKRERLEARAEKAHQQSDCYYQSSKKLADMLPFGQPILIGHHSEARARRHADKIFNEMGKSVAASKKAAYLENKAMGIGKNGIASDDLEAIQKLRAKLASLEKAQEMMKAANKVVRSQHMTEADKIEYMVTSLSLTKEQATAILTPDFCGRVGFASYALTNNSATIRQTKQRLDELEVMHNQEPLSAEGEIEGLFWSLYEEDGRVKFTFDGKPSDEIRTLLKTQGFKWSRYSMAWVRKLTPNAIQSTRYILSQWGMNN